jgi:uncharacterized glyoxalase superfamily protein PhnB
LYRIRLATQIESANVRPADGAWIALEVDDVDAIFSRLAENGVTARTAPTSLADERQCYVNEPNGIGVVFFAPLT